jgi:crotonobetainyl-CoA:carnitine CoA-transferase CaiB-like acyl-CoA transferase
MVDLDKHSHSLPRANYVTDELGPLDGIRVLDLSRLLAGNTLSQQLADYGADVIKIEPLKGDTLRGWRTKGIETSWKSLARNKRSLCLDFRRAEATELIRRLIPGAAILIESFRPGSLEDMGLAPEVLHNLEPRLILARISGWGQSGPYRRRPGFGSLVEGFAGFAEMNGYADRPPLLPPMGLADALCGLTGAFACMAALREVEINGGQGQVIDLSLLDPIVNALGPQAANYRLSGLKRERMGSRSHLPGPRNVYQAKDGGWVCMSASTQGMAERAMDVVGGQELANDPRFKIAENRVVNATALDQIIGEFVAQRTVEENVKFFEDAEVTIGPVNDISRLMENEHVHARGLFTDYPDPDMGHFPTHAITSRMSKTPGSIRTSAPRLGEHTRDILTESGLTPVEINTAITSGIVWETI